MTRCIRSRRRSTPRASYRRQPRDGGPHGQQGVGRHRRRQALHWAHVLDASGQQILSRRVENDEVDLLKLIDEVLALSEEPVWAVDQPGGSAALLLALLWERNQQVLYFPGLAVD